MSIDGPLRRLAVMFFLSLSVVLGAASTAQAEDTPAQIVKASLDYGSTGLQSGLGTMTIITEDKTGARKIRQLQFKGKATDAGRRTLIRLLSPGEVKGQAFLFSEVRDGEDLVHWYLPAFGVTRRIQGGKKKGAFMGTHFTYADLESRDIKDAAYKKTGIDKIGPHEVHVIEASPKKGGDSEYGKVVLYIRTTDNMMLKARFYDRGGKEAKVLFVEKVSEASGKKYASQMTLRPKSGGFTKMSIDALDNSQIVPDSAFTPEALANE